MNPRLIVIDGKTYKSVEEMPEDVRQRYEEAMRGFSDANPVNAPGAMDILNQVFADKNKNGVPDLFEGDQVINVTGGMKFFVDGRTIDNINELPPDARAKYEQAMGAMDRNRNGMPDYLEGMLSPSDQTVQPVMTSTGYTADAPRQASRPPIPASPTITPDTSNGWMLALAVLALLFVCAAGAIGVWYFFLR